MLHTYEYTCQNCDKTYSEKERLLYNIEKYHTSGDDNIHYDCPHCHRVKWTTENRIRIKQSIISRIKERNAINDLLRKINRTCERNNPPLDRYNILSKDTEPNTKTTNQNDTNQSYSTTVPNADVIVSTCDTDSSDNGSCGGDGGGD